MINFTSTNLFSLNRVDQAKLQLILNKNIKEHISHTHGSMKQSTQRRLKVEQKQIRNNHRKLGKHVLITRAITSHRQGHSPFSDSKINLHLKKEPS